MPISKSKFTIIFYILAIYICLQFAWWSYMLLSLNHQVYTLKKEIQRPLIQATEVLEKDWNKKKLMIIGEGSVFLLLLLYGFYKTKSAFNKELSFANQKKNFILSITHELKSPISSIKLNLQTIQKRALEETLKNTIINNALKDTERLNSLVENLLLAARIESNNLPLHKEKTNLNTFISETLQSEADIVSDKHTVFFKIDPAISLDIDKLAFTSILLNLFENAIKYSPINSSITIEVSQKNEHSFIRFIDEGKGIPLNEKALIFTKFYRVGNEDTRKTKGTGLGLFLVKHLVELHRGQINVMDNYPKGSIFELKFFNQTSNEQ